MCQALVVETTRNYCLPLENYHKLYFALFYGNQINFQLYYHLWKVYL